MKIKLMFSFLIVLTFSLSGFAQEPEWLVKIRKVVLLTSTREDVAKIFGKPYQSINPYFVFYKTKDGKITIEYSRGLCSNKEEEGWNVPEFTVTRIFLDFKEPQSFNTFPIKIDEFYKHPVSDVPDAFSYENDESGISYPVTPKGIIKDIEFYPSSKFDYLHCSEQKF